MAPLADIGKYKRLAELYVLALKSNPAISAVQNNTAIDCLMDTGLNERQAEKFLNTAFEQFERGMMRGPEQTLHDVSTAFRYREQPYILGHIQSILEAGEIDEGAQEFFDLCNQHLHNGE